MSMSSNDRNSTRNILIVSGLPRSGTSLLMKILDQCGFPIYSDGKREGDAHNPGGYYEHENVKSLGNPDADLSWLEDCIGKTVKIVSPLLVNLPKDKGYNYFVLFMRRSISEIVSSQDKMIKAFKDANLDLPGCIGSVQGLWSSGLIDKVVSVFQQHIIEVTEDWQVSNTRSFREISYNLLVKGRSFLPHHWDYDEVGELEMLSFIIKRFMWTFGIPEMSDEEVMQVLIDTIDPALNHEVPSVPLKSLKDVGNSGKLTSEELRYRLKKLGYV